MVGVLNSRFLLLWRRELPFQPAEEEMDKKMENGIRKEEQARSSLNLNAGSAYDALDVYITFNRSQSCLSYTYRILHLLKPNSWAKNFVEVSGHNLRSSQTWDFRIQCLHLQTSFKPILLGGGGGLKLKLKTFVPITFKNSTSVSCPGNSLLLTFLPNMKSIVCPFKRAALRITGLAFSDQSDLPAFSRLR